MNKIIILPVNDLLNINNMKNFTTIIRILLGALILFSGANKFGHWLNASFMHDAMAWVIHLSDIGGGFIIYCIGLLEIIVGIALIVNKFVTLAAMALLPLMVSILIFHMFLDLKGIGIALIVLAMDIFMVYENRDKVSAMFQPNS